MADHNGVPLDEIQWREPEVVRWFNGVNADNFHLYFNASPFCDPSSNNKSFELQAQFDPQLQEVLRSRDAFEDHMKATIGVKYLVEDGPRDNSVPDVNPVWVVRKVNRSREWGDRLEGTYYAVEDRVYQAPSLKDILQCRLLSITDSLSKVYETAAEMQYFDPSMGYSYTESSATPEAAPKPAASAGASVASTPMPDSSLKPSSASRAQQPNVLQEASLLESLTLSMKYADEYMDANPLNGEPGSFVFSSTQSHLKAQAAAAQAHAAKLAAAAVAADPRSANASAVGTPLPAELRISTDAKARKGSSGTKTPISAGPLSGKPKFNRKKSRAENSPLEPRAGEDV